MWKLLFYLFTKVLTRLVNPTITVKTGTKSVILKVLRFSQKDGEDKHILTI